MNRRQLLLTAGGFGAAFATPWQSPAEASMESAGAGAIAGTTPPTAR